jgi:hypothetical protein
LLNEKLKKETKDFRTHGPRQILEQTKYFSYLLTLSIAANLDEQFRYHKIGCKMHLDIPSSSLREN